MIKGVSTLIVINVTPEFDAELHLTERVHVLTAGAAGPRLFTIHQVDANANNLPKAHTWCVLHAAADTHVYTHTPNMHTVFIIMKELSSFQSFTHMNSLFLQLQSD